VQVTCIRLEHQVIREVRELGACVWSKIAARSTLRAWPFRDAAYRRRVRSPFRLDSRHDRPALRAHPNGHKLTYFFALHLAHLAFCAAAIRLRAAGDIELRGLAIDTIFRPLALAQRAR